MGSNFVLTGVSRALIGHWWIFLLLLVSVAVFEYLKTSKGKGRVGEELTKLALKLKLNSSQYKTLHNLKLKDKFGWTQIDLIIASQYGIFVIEVKNYAGAIYGSPNDKYWVQVLGNKRNKFYNPLKQNYRHKMAVAEYLKVDPGCIHSVVFFAGDADLRNSMPPNVIKSGLSAYIRKFNEKCFSPEQVEEIYEKLKKKTA